MPHVFFFSLALDFLRLLSIVMKQAFINSGRGRLDCVARHLHPSFENKTTKENWKNNLNVMYARTSQYIPLPTGMRPYKFSS